MSTYTMQNGTFDFQKAKGFVASKLKGEFPITGEGKGSLPHIVLSDGPRTAVVSFAGLGELSNIGADVIEDIIGGRLNNAIADLRAEKSAAPAG